MSQATCTNCDHVEDMDYNLGEWINDKYLCTHCIENMDEDELDDFKDKGR